MLKFYFKLIILFSLFFTPYKGFTFSTKAKQAIIIDYNSGDVIFEHNSHEAMIPSSMSKLMTLYLAFKKLKEGTIKLETLCQTSNKAWKIKGSTMFLKSQQKADIKTLLEGIIIVSANDASISLAECLEGSEKSFTEQMNQTAKKLHLKESVFKNATGWPVADHVMSAYDIGQLAIHLFEEFPEYYSLFSRKEFTFNKIKQPNTNRLLTKSLGVDGIKTGHTKEGGYGIVASSIKDGRRIFIVVNGLPSDNARVKEAENLINYAFSNFETTTLFKKGEKITQVKLSKKKFIDLIADKDITITYPKAEKAKVQQTITLMPNICLPIKEGEILGSLEIKIPGQSSKNYVLRSSTAHLAPWWYKWWPF